MASTTHWLAVSLVYTKTANAVAAYWDGLVTLPKRKKAHHVFWEENNAITKAVA